MASSRQLTITVDATNPRKPAVSVDASASDPASVAWAAQHKTQLTAAFAQLKTNFYAAHTADDHQRQRQKLAAVTRNALIAAFPGEDFAVATVTGIVSAAVKGA
jgi:hypothetical protein